MDSLDTRCKDIPSLKDIIVNFEVYNEEEENPDDDLTKKKMRDYGWTVTTTKLPRKVWISNDEYGDEVEFDNEEDWIEHIEEMERREADQEFLREYTYWGNV